MEVYFFDSCALVKRYVAEAGSAWVSSLIDPTAGNRVFISRITAVEVVSAIARRERIGNLSTAAMDTSLTQFRRELVTIYLPIDVSRRLISLAMSLAEGHALRGYDAVQLATALEVNNMRLASSLSASTLISADATLNAAATQEGLTVDDPNFH